MRDVLPGRVSHRRAPWAIGAALALATLYSIFHVAALQRPAGAESTPPTNADPPMRVPLWVDPDDVRYRTRFSFTFDPIEALADYRRNENLDRIAGSGDTFVRVNRLLEWTSIQWEPGRPDPYPPIDARVILRDIRAGRTGGFCAQYNYVFVQAVQSFGWRARYVTIRGHEVTEVWIPELRKWVCFDPLHNAWFSDPGGAPLSVHEIYTAVRAGAPVRVNGDLRNVDEATHVAKFSKFAVWIRNDHVSAPINFTDIGYHKVHFIDPDGEPRPVPAFALSTTYLRDLYFDPRSATDDDSAPPAR